MTTDTAALHTCSLYCDRPDCIRQQRDEWRDMYGQGWSPETAMEFYLEQRDE